MFLLFSDQSLVFFFFLPLPGMNSKRMSLSSFFEFLNLNTKLMGALTSPELAAACGANMNRSNN